MRTQHTRIERTEPIQIHKGLVIRAIEIDPSKWRQVTSDERFNTPDEVLEFLRNASEEWFVGGEFITDEERQARLSKH